MITLTGSEGFIGSHIIADEHIDIKTGQDICDLKDIKGDVVIHLASVSSIPKSLLDPVETNRTNLIGLENIIELCKLNNAHLIFTSSCSVAYPLSPYAYSKLIGEYMIKQSGISNTILRLGNVYGEGDDKSAIYHFKKDKEITIFGDGNIKRNFVYVKDVVDVINNFAITKINGIFKVGHENLTIGEVASYFNKPIKYAEPKTGDAPDLSFESDLSTLQDIKDWIQQ